MGVDSLETCKGTSEREELIEAWTTLINCEKKKEF